VRSLWRGVLSFGLVSVPVRLYAATESRDVRLRYLHAPCAAPVQYRKTCSRCGREVGPDELALGYESAPDTFVLLEEEELSELPAGPEHAVEIERFVPLHSVDPIFLAKAYYLEPLPGGHKAYQLLHRAMTEEERAAVVRISLRRRERWALVRAGEASVLHLETLLDADEVRPAADIQVGEPVPLRPGELELARDLVRALAAPFRPETQPDRYRTALAALIERKVAAGKAVESRPPAEAGRVVDLMEALRASVRRATAEAPEPEGEPVAASPPGGRGRHHADDAPPSPRTHAGARGGRSL
jgi:DNA end-binding protein Ku